MTTQNNANTNGQQTADASFMDKVNCSALAGYVGVAAATALSVSSGRSLGSCAAGAIAGTAYSYLVGTMMDPMIRMTGNTGIRVAAGVCIAAGAFGVTSNMTETIGAMMSPTNTENLF